MGLTRSRPMKIAATLLIALVCAGCASESSATPGGEVPNGNPSSSEFAATGSPVTTLSDMTVLDAAEAIGARCGAPKDFERSCTWEGPDFKTFFVPGEESYASYRDQVCQYFDENPKVLTDGKTWSVYGDNDADT